ncbi:outer membrane lipid asymmetry maintenance protein MlaD [Sulfuriflexus sp.]|uniref:outer membrane lipid asymmetry maintenance protein MlaD n=1 Tax=Sulfuriflexus sp. TaxID=2015443 RepID=UPI0028CD9804|nr:outer membrane lipid asymmetry maintenance protein MlaD [Sulfuriflexus sp.]MDT8403498.1 outer membrane lipid asymmetry maintenance protein MlaD [Sulfuriflexus sp.]
MHNSKALEIIVGLFVVLGLAALFMLAMKVSNLTTFAGEDGYEVTARFENIGGLKVRSPVTVAGVRVGRVSAIGFDNKTFEAVITMTISKDYDVLPTDTSASIFTSGLLGEQYVSLEPGGSEKSLNQGSEIRLTQSAIVLEQVIGQFLYSQAESAGESR